MTISNEPSSNQDLQSCGTCKCGKPGEPDHICPYAQDIRGDSESLCNCCCDCEYICASDI